MTPQARREAGFTLIELMIALGLFALISMAGLALVDSLLGIQTRTGSRLDRLAEVQRAMYLLNTDLAQVSGGDMTGDATGITFYRGATELGGLIMPVRYAAGGGTLARVVGSGKMTVGQRVLGGVQAIRWQFYAPASGWVDRWPIAPPPPKAPPPWPAAVAAEITLRPDASGISGTVRRVVALPARQ